MMNAQLTKPQVNLPVVERHASDQAAGFDGVVKSPVYWNRFFAAVAALVFCFSVPLYQLLQLSVHSELYSYIPLIPVVSIWFGWQERKHFPNSTTPASGIAAYFFLMGIIAPVFFCLKATATSPGDFLSVSIFGFVSLIAGSVAFFLGREIFRTLVFPLSLLIFFIPLPDELRHALETFLQIGSAAAANAFFTLSGIPFWQDGLRFQLPGINLQVAPECSGIHSSLVLFITSFVAAKLFLQPPLKRAILILSTIPLALLRNGFRIFVIGKLCIRHGAEALDSPVHRHGGPLFFALSLLPLFGLLLLLRLRQNGNAKTK